MLQLLEMILALLVQIVDGAGRVFYNLLALRNLAVDDTHGVFLHTLPAGGTQGVLMLSQIRKQRVIVILLTVGTADAVDMKLHILKTQLLNQGRSQGNDFHLCQGAPGTYELHAKLMMLAETAALGLLITERLGHII